MNGETKLRSNQTIFSGSVSELNDVTSTQSENTGKVISTNGTNLVWTKINTKCALQVEVSYNGDTVKGVNVVLNNSITKTTKSNGTVMFTGLDSGNNTIALDKDGYIGDSMTKNLENPMEFQEVIMTPVALTFTVIDENEKPLMGAEITVGEETAITDASGKATIYGLLDGQYDVSIVLFMYDTYTGTVTINRSNVNEAVTMYIAPVACYASENVTEDTNVLANYGVGDSEYEYNIVNTDSTNKNTLSLNAITRGSAQAGEEVMARVTTDDSTIIVEAREKLPEGQEGDGPIIEDVNFECNNSNQLNTVTIKANAISRFLCFTKGDNKLYFENQTYPFIANVSNNRFTSKSYTYYKYENGVMVPYTGTTSNDVVDDKNTYNGTTLVISSADDLYSHGTWTRSPEDDVEMDVGTVDIVSSSYLTDVNPVIPITYKRIQVQSLNRSIWDQVLIYDGRVIENFPDGIGVWIKSGEAVTIHNFKKNSTLMRDDYALQSLITIDKFYYKYNFTLVLDNSIEFEDSKIKLGAGDSAKPEMSFDFTGRTATMDIYQGVTVWWSASKSGYVSQSGSYTLGFANYTKTIQLVANSVVLTINDGTNILAGATVDIDGTQYTSDSNGEVTLTGVADGIHNVTVSMAGYITATNNFTVAGANASETISLEAQYLKITVQDSDTTDVDNITNYTGNEIVNHVATMSSYNNTRLYFTPNFSVSDIFSASSWAIDMKFKYRGKYSSYATFANMGSAPLSGSKDYQAFSIGIEQNNICLFLSSDGSGWDIVSKPTTDTQITMTEGSVYDFKLEFTGTQYIFSGKLESDNTYTTLQTVSSSTKIGTSDNSTATIIFGSNGFTGTVYQLYADWYLKYCSVTINGIMYPLANSSAIYKADVTFDGNSYVTDMAGQVEIAPLPYGTYTYSVSATGYVTQSGLSITTSSPEETVTVTMIPNA